MLPKFPNHDSDPPLPINHIRTMSYNQRLKTFSCSYCSIAYRTQGYLARHLKSKMHITTLLTLGKLPSDFFISSKEKYNDVWLDDMDTSNCERALQSLLVIIENLRHNGQCPTSPQQNGFHMVPKHISDSLCYGFHPFRCSYCSVGFSAQGHLARHLKTNMHLMTLFSLGKLPRGFDPYSTKKYNDSWLDGLDTSNCERARQSLLEIIEKLCPSGPNQKAIQQQSLFNNTGSDTSKLSFAQSSSSDSNRNLNGIKIRDNINTIRPLFCPSAKDPATIAVYKKDERFHLVPENAADSPCHIVRPFRCTYCSIGYMSHGYLARHLKSNLHVMKLFSIGKLPTYFNPYFIKKLDKTWLDGTDTTNCERALESLLVIIEKLGFNSQKQSALQQPQLSIITELDHSEVNNAKTTETHRNCSTEGTNVNDQNSIVVHNSTEDNQQDVMPKNAPNLFSAGLKPFRCYYCSIGFNAHSNLARHLKTKKHITRLLILGKLPSDIILLSAVKYDCDWLDQMDTTNCENALKSLLAIIDKLRHEDQRNRALQQPSSSGSTRFKLRFARKRSAFKGLISNNLAHHQLNSTREPNFVDNPNSTTTLSLEKVVETSSTMSKIRPTPEPEHLKNSMTEPMQHPVLKTPSNKRPKQFRFHIVKFADEPEVKRQRMDSDKNTEDSMSATSSETPLFEQTALSDKREVESNQ